MSNSDIVSWPGWETVKLIGRGSFGAVYEIQRDVMGETESAALKVISIPQSSSDVDEMYSDGYDEESITATFKEHLKGIVAEYTLMRKMSDCANVVRCDDVRYVQHDNGIGWDIYIKMELLTPLTKALPDAISDEMVIKLAKDICNALITCKKHDVVHRDIKPQNIFVSNNGAYKLGDFGIAKTIEKTSSGTKIGTYKYMAPEVYNNQPYGSAADIYSLGLVLYWLLNDRRMPFLPNASQKITASMEEEARNRRLAGERIPAPVKGSAALKSIVLKACAFSPTERYKTPGEMMTDLENISTASHRSTQGQSSSQYNGSGKGKTENVGGPSGTTNVDLDVRSLVWITEKEAIDGCTKNATFAGLGSINVKIPAGTKNGTILRLVGAGRKDPVTGKKGNAFVTVQYVNWNNADSASKVFSEFFGGQDNAVERDGVYTGVISSKEARKGCSKTFNFKNGTSKTIQVPAGCKNGQLVDGVKVYVHDFSTKENNMEKLPDAVLNMYANKSSGMVSGIVLSFVVWMIFGMSTMLIPVMAGGLMISIGIAVARGIKRQQTINEAKRIIQIRQRKK